MNKLNNILYKLWNNYFIVILIVILISIKISWLNLPFYWDEAWSYAMAIFDMANNGPTLIPGQDNEWLTRGHPLFFYLIASSWLVVYSKTVLSAHLFALFISCCSLFIVHFCTKKIVSVKEANFVALALISQIMFIAQSTLLLPEIFLMGLSFWVFYLYIQKKWWLFIVVSCCLILSKETALVLFFVLLFDKIVLQKLIHRKEYIYNLNLIKELFFITVPLLLFGLFLILQKKNLGYYFYPEHIELMNFNFGAFLKKWGLISEWVFIRQARWIWTFAAIPVLIIVIIKNNITKREIHLLILSGFYILGYLLFSGFNFFTPRYILTLLPFLFLIFTLLIVKCFPCKTGILLLSAAIIGNLVFGFFLSDGEMDTSRRFNQTIIAHKEAINFCEQQQWQDNNINTGFLMTFNMKQPQLGYLNNYEKPFLHCGNFENPDIYICYTKNSEPDKEKIDNDPLYELVKNIVKQNGCVVSIYIRKK
jgi:hypothetical protein